jgi:hypothetical protein
MEEARFNAVPKYPWQQAIFDALVECHSARLREKLAAAEAAISERLLQGTAGLRELAALKDALRVLDVVFPKEEARIDAVRKDVA